ncbi:MAG: NUDIX domain-containing protein [Rhabdochlamydiaceae bacterium]|jgi:8-oxo-dGTP pyrophosphatase MutT (NUDIX family)
MRVVQEESFGIIPLIWRQSHWHVLLVLHQKGKHWAFPKGHGNPGESPLQSAERELKEETGLNVDSVLQDDPLVEKYRFYRKQEIIQKKVSYFPAIVSGDLILQEEEIQDAKWVLLEEAVSHLFFNESKSMCKALLQFLKKS